MLPHIGEETIRVPGDDLSVGLIFFGDFIRAILDGFAAHQTVKDNPAYFVDLQVFTGVVDEDDRPALLGIQGYLIPQTDACLCVIGLRISATFPLLLLVAFQTGM